MLPARSKPRPREKILQSGPDTLEDAELLSLLIRTGHQTASVELFAGQLIESHGGLRELLMASPEELMKARGIGPAKGATLLAIRELAKRLHALDARQAPTRVESDVHAYNLFRDLALESQETLVAAFLDQKSRLIRKKTIFTGTAAFCSVSTREILREALRANALKILVAHNHPSQIPQPSDEDKTFTRGLREASRLVGIEFVDHLIVCLGGRYFSFRRECWPIGRAPTAAMTGLALD